MDYSIALFSFYIDILREKGVLYMAKQLNVNVAVTADTAAAKAQLQELQNTL